MRRVLVTGSQHWTDRQVIGEALIAVRDDPNLPGDGKMLLVHGACPAGADRIAHELAEMWGWDIETHPANWRWLGRRAGIVRNEHMVNLGADVVLAFILDNSPGSTHCANLAEERGLDVRRFVRDSQPT